MPGDLRSRAARATVLAVLAVLALLALGAAAQARPAAPSTREPFGINNGVLWPDGLNLLPTARHAAAIGRTGLASVRAVAFWDQIEPQAPDGRTGRHSYDWTRPDAIAGHLARNGLRWDPVLGFSTPWAGEIPGTTGGTPKIAPYATYAAAIAERYGRDGDFWDLHPELPYVPMTNYQVWNEANLPGSLTGLSAGRYANLYLAARSAILAVDPHARVAVGGLVHSSPSGDGNAGPYLRAMFAARPDLAGNVDALGITTYRQLPEQVLDQLHGAREILDGLGERTTPIDLAETGWATRGTVPLTDITAITEAQRAVNLTQLVTLLAASDCGLASVQPFAWVTAEDSPLDAAAWFGIADRNTAALKPSGQAYVDAVRAVQVAPPAVLPVCGRPDLPRLLDGARGRAPWTVRAGRRSCRARRFTLTYTAGPDAEPYSRVTIRLPGGRPREVRDPDGQGPAALPTAVRLPIARRRGAITVVAHDARGAQAQRTRIRVRPCVVARRR